MREEGPKDRAESFGNSTRDQEANPDLNRRAFVRTAVLVGAGVVSAMPIPQKLNAHQDLELSAQANNDSRGSSQPASVLIPEVRIRMRSPDSVLVGVSPVEVIEIRLADVLKFHGYCAGGVAFSFRAAQEAFKVLYKDSLPERQNLKVQTSFHCCQAGALAYITGARTDFGAIPNRGDLVLIPEEMQKIVFMDKKTGERAVLKPLFNPHKIFSPLFQRLRKDHSFSPQVQKTLNDAVHQYIYGPAEKLFQEVEKG